MSAPGSNLAETKSLLLEMLAEANELKTAAGGSVTDAVAAWLAPQYLLAARQKLAAGEEAGRFEVLRTFVQDWATLRHGDHTAERLQIECGRLALAKEEAEKKWQTKLEAGLDALAEEFKVQPEALKLYRQARALMTRETE